MNRLEDGGDLEAYKCKICSRWHVGRRPNDPQLANAAALRHLDWLHGGLVGDRHL